MVAYCRDLEGGPPRRRLAVDVCHGRGGGGSRCSCSDVQYDSRNVIAVINPLEKMLTFAGCERKPMPQNAPGLSAIFLLLFAGDRLGPPRVTPSCCIRRRAPTVFLVLAHRSRHRRGVAARASGWSRARR